MSNRDKFEAWYLENWGHTEDNHETLFERSPDDEYGYYRLGVRMSHKAWQEATELSAKQLVESERYGRQADITIENLERKVERLAAENACLKQSIDEVAEAFETGTDGVLATAIGESLNLLTPETDSVLKRIQAQGVAMFASKCKEESKRAHSSDSRDSWWVSGENADDFAAQLRQEAK